MKDIYRIFHGRANKIDTEQHILRNAVAILADVFNQTMGGNGAREAVLKMWPMKGDDPGGREMTKEERRALIKWHNQTLEAKKKRE
jgi:hypothetical protein